MIPIVNGRVNGDSILSRCDTFDMDALLHQISLDIGHHDKNQDSPFKNNYTGIFRKGGTSW